MWHRILQVYGETSFELVDQMIQSIDFSPEDNFIDLGSGKISITQPQNVIVNEGSHSIVVPHWTTGQMIDPALGASFIPNSSC